jgi:hypothetical protein
MDPMAGLMTNAAAPAGAPATVDVNWTLFQSIYSAVDLPIVNAVNGVLDALAAYLNPIMISMLTAYMMFTGLRMALAPNGAPMQTMMMDVVRGALVVTLVGNAGNFNQWIGTLFLTTIPMRLGRLSTVHLVLVARQSTAVLSSMRCGMPPIRPAWSYTTTCHPYR